MFDFGVTLILYVFILPKVWKGYSRRHIVFYIAVRCQRTILIILVAIMKTICWISNYFIAGFFVILKVARHANLLLDGSIKNLFFFLEYDFTKLRPLFYMNFFVIFNRNRKHRLQKSEGNISVRISNKSQVVRIPVNNCCFNPFLH